MRGLRVSAPPGVGNSQSTSIRAGIACYAVALTAPGAYLQQLWDATNTHEMRVEEREQVSVGRREQRQARLVHAEAVAQSRLVPVCLWLDHNAGGLGVEVG